MPNVNPTPEYISLVANGAINKYQAVGIDSNGKAVPLTSASITNHPPRAIALAAVSNGVTANFLAKGIVKDTVAFSFAAGKVFIDGSGQPTQTTAGLAIIAAIGTSRGSTSLWVDPDLYILRISV